MEVKGDKLAAGLRQAEQGREAEILEEVPGPVVTGAQEAASRATDRRMIRLLR